MTKIGDKEDPLVHIQKHIDAAAARAQTTSSLMAQLIGGVEGVTLQDVFDAGVGAFDRMTDALHHIRQLQRGKSP